MGEPARSSIVVRLVSILAVGAVAAALLVGFFFGGDFGAAFQHVGGLAAGGPEGESRLRGTVETAGSARLDGSCRDAEVADQARRAALQNARGRAEDRCRELPGAPPNARFALKADAEPVPALAERGGKCHATVQVSWTCLFGAR